jgi:hypothetical protein
VVTRLATDVVLFDQLACSSPQYVFVRGRPGEAAFDGFVDSFGRAFATQAARFRRHSLDYHETYRIVSDRARAVLDGGTLHRDTATQWSVAVMTSPSEAIQCANRFVQVVPWCSLDEIYPRIPENVQTVVVALSERDAVVFTEEAAKRGVCRFPIAGESSHFENPWDGIGLVGRLTRHVVRTERSSSEIRG